MATDNEVLAYLDALVAAEKTILGRVGWHASGRPDQAVTFKAALAINGDTNDGMFFQGRFGASGFQTWMQLTLSWQSIPLDRLSFRPPGFHTNKRPNWAPLELHLQRFTRRVTRRYAWADNRHMPHEHDAEMARTVNEMLADAGAAITYMKRELNIIGLIPTPVYQPTLFP